MKNIVSLLVLCLGSLGGAGCGAGKGYGHRTETVVTTRYWSEPLPGSLQQPVAVPYHYSSTSSRGYFYEEGRGSFSFAGSSYIRTPDGRWVQVGFSDPGFTYGFTNEVRYTPSPIVPWTR